MIVYNRQGEENVSHKLLPEDTNARIDKILNSGHGGKFVIISQLITYG